MNPAARQMASAFQRPGSGPSARRTWCCCRTGGSRRAGQRATARRVGVSPNHPQATGPAMPCRLPRFAGGRPRSVEAVGRDDAAHHGVDGLCGRCGAASAPVPRRRSGRAGRRSACSAARSPRRPCPAAQHRLELLTAGPAVHHPGHAAVRVAGERQPDVALAVLQPAQSRYHLARPPRATSSLGIRGDGLGLVATRLVDQRRHDGGQARRRRAASQTPSRRHSAASRSFSV